MPTQRTRLVLSVEGADVLANKLDPQRLYGTPVGSLIEEAARLGQKQASKRAPQLTGRLAGAIQKQIHASGATPYATLTVNAVSHGGFRYGFALDASKKYHYAGRKRETKGWFSKVPAIIRRLIRQQLKRAEKEIEVGFEQGGSIR